MSPDRTLIQRAPTWYFYGWAVLLLVAILVAVTRPWYLGVGVLVGFGVFSWMVGRSVVRRAVWLTPEEIVVVNGAETIAVPRQQTSVDVVMGPSSLLAVGRDRPDWDNSRRARRLLYLTHHGAEKPERVQVEAALGLTPPNFDALVDTLRGVVQD